MNSFFLRALFDTDHNGKKFIFFDWASPNFLEIQKENRQINFLNPEDQLQDILDIGNLIYFKLLYIVYCIFYNFCLNL